MNPPEDQRNKDAHGWVCYGSPRWLRPLNNRQEKVLAYLIYYADHWGIQPNMAQTARYIGVSRWAIRSTYWSLYQKRYIGRPERGFMGFKLIKRPDGQLYYRPYPGNKGAP
jgi:hypothetical protein